MMAKRHPAPKLTSAQLEIMNVVWERGQATVAEVWEQLREQKGLARNTVQTTLVRLEEKGHLRHRKSGNAFVYYPTNPRENTLRSMLKSLVNVAFEGSAAGLVMTLLQDEQLSDEDVKRIKTLLDENRVDNK